MKRALLSVSDKTGLVDFAKGLQGAGVELLSTGGTAAALEKGGLRVTQVSEYTESPEIMDGRVKTLHPRVHGGILMRGEQDIAALESIGGQAIDLVVVNLYPFEDTVKRGAAHPEVIENIDIGGPSMVRSAAKNHARVVILVDPADYAQVLDAIVTKGEVDLALRERLAAKAFSHTASYDAAISAYFAKHTSDLYPELLSLSFEKAYGLRYGENPHQTGAFYVERSAPEGSLALAESLGAGGKELSYNNLVDCEAALEAVREFRQPAAVVVKHTNPCGVACADTIEEAYRVAREADALSAFGGIVALNREVDEKTAAGLAETFLECVVAPSYSEAALALLKQKKNLRLLKTGEPSEHGLVAAQYRRVSGGLLVQDSDRRGASEVQEAKVVTDRVPTEQERAALDFAWRVCKHVKSNAIVLAAGSAPLRTVGVGAGQMSRVVAVELAANKAGELAKGSVLASDAFFPFPDGVEAAARAGVVAVVQPGGSRKDDEVIAAANKAGIVMVFTGKRHFRH